VHPERERIVTITRRVVANLVVFGLVALALVAYGVFDLLGNPFASTTTVSAVFPSASGLTTGFSVAYDGIVVGSVTGVSLVPHGAKVTMSIQPGEHVPADVAARIIIANTLGQQEVELVPRPSGDAGSTVTAASADTGGRHAHQVLSVTRRDLSNGEVLPIAPDSAPATIGTLVTEAAKILDAIPPGDLNNLLHQAALAVAGQADNLQTIAAASATFSQEFLDYQQQFQQLLANAPPVLDTVTANAQSFQQGLAETASLLATLATARGNLADLLHVGSTATSDANQLVVENRANLGCLVHDLADTATNLAEPTNYANLGTFFATNGGFFSIVQRVAPAGPARALTTSDHPRSNQVQLRVRLLLPPQQPPAEQYATPHGLTPIRPGAACDTEFGAGVPAVSQPGFVPADGGTVIAPTAADAQVRGGGPVAPTPQTAENAGDQLPVPAAPPAWPLVVAALAAFGAMLVVGRRHGARSARAVRLAAAVEPRATGGQRRIRWLERHRTQKSRR
jgi:ABC-type transporter Mla subunit MlaD